MIILIGKEDFRGVWGLVPGAQFLGGPSEFWTQPLCIQATLIICFSYLLSSRGCWVRVFRKEVKLWASWVGNGQESWPRKQRRKLESSESLVDIVNFGFLSDSNEHRAYHRATACKYLFFHFLLLILLKSLCCRREWSWVQGILDSGMWLGGGTSTCTIIVVIVTTAMAASDHFTCIHLFNPHDRFWGICFSYMRKCSERDELTCLKSYSHMLYSGRSGIWTQAI